MNTSTLTTAGTATKTARNLNGPVINGLDLAALSVNRAQIAADSNNAQVRFAVATDWVSGTQSRSRVTGYDLAGQRIHRDFTILSDEPGELLGGNTAPNPQELLLAALNACMGVGYVAGAALRGITLRHLRIESEAALDLRGFFGEPGIPAGAPEINLRIEIAGDADTAAFREIHAQVMKTSPNWFHLTQPVRIAAVLHVKGGG